MDIKNLLNQLGITDKFNKKASEAYEKAKAEVDDASIFENKDAFLEHYTNSIFGDSTNTSIAVDDFLQKAIDGGFMSKDDADGLSNLQSISDTDGDNKVSKGEAATLYGAVYDAGKANEAKDEVPDYEEVTVQSWGTGEDDCMSRIIQKHVGDIKLYGDDYKEYVKQVCELNNIENSSIISTGSNIKLPPLKKDADGNILRDADGKIQVYSQDEINAAKEAKKAQEQEPTKEITDKDGNVVAIENNEYDENGKLTKTTKTTKDGKNISEKNFNDKGQVKTEVKYSNSEGNTGKMPITVAYKYDDNGNVIEEEQTDANGNKISKNAYEYDDNGNKVKNTVYDKDGNLESTIKYNWADGNLESSEQYDKNGKLKSVGTDFYNGNENKPKNIELYNEDGTTKGFFEYEYDENGMETKKAEKDADKHMIISHEFEYDDVGNWTKSTVYDWKGDKTSTTKAAYDENGNLKETNRYDENDKLVRKKTYDENGNETVKNYDENGNEIKEVDVDGKTYIATYDEDGKLTSLKEKDAPTGENQEETSKYGKEISSKIIDGGRTKVITYEDGTKVEYHKDADGNFTVEGTIYTNDGEN